MMEMFITLGRAHVIFDTKLQPSYFPARKMNKLDFWKSILQVSNHNQLETTTASREISNNLWRLTIDTLGGNNLRHARQKIPVVVQRAEKLLKLQENGRQ